jgi:hypothetical protein
LRVIGWGGLALHFQVLVRPAATSLRAGERVGTVLVRGANGARTGAVARRSLGGPSFGWRLQHVL